MSCPSTCRGLNNSRYKIGHHLTDVLITDFIVLGHLLEVILRRRTW